MRAFAFCLAAVGILSVGSAWATSVPRLSFEELTDRSELIVRGQVARHWAAWDAEHKYIWTHYEVTVAKTLKGQANRTVVVSEPGGIVGEMGMRIAGSVGYTAGDNVLIFLERMPNGYLRTTGWGQGQYRIDPSGVIRASESLKSVQLVSGTSTAPALESLTGKLVTEMENRVSTRLRSRPAVGGAR